MSSSKPEEIPAEEIVDVLKAKGEKNERSKSRKKEIRSVEGLLKSMNNLTIDAKLKTFTEKYAELLEENRTTVSSLKVCERHIQVLLKEKEQLKTENGKSLLARSRLEELCRELQRQNKVVKEESIVRVREEEERRKEVSSKFQSTLAEVSALLQQNNDKNQKLRDENSEMASKLQMLCDQYSLREQHLEKLGRQYDIERQLNEAKVAKIRMDSAEAKEKMLREKQLLLLELTEYQKKCQVMQEEEVALRQQLTMYTDKYDDFQMALKASNQQFVGFKGQMDEMTKKLKSLEKETAQWKQRWEKSNSLLLDMASEKKQRDSELLCTTKQLAQLEKLCRALQTERVSLINEIKSKKTVTVPDSFEHVATELIRPENFAAPTHESSAALDEEKLCGNDPVSVIPTESDDPVIPIKEKDSSILDSHSYVTICEQPEVQDSLHFNDETCTDIGFPVSDSPSQSHLPSFTSDSINKEALADSPTVSSAEIN